MEQINNDNVDIRFEHAIDGTAKNPMYIKLKEQTREIPIYGIFRNNEEKFTELKKILRNSFKL